MKIQATINLPKGEERETKVFEAKRFENIPALLRAFAISEPKWTSMVVTVVKEANND